MNCVPPAIAPSAGARLAPLPTWRLALAAIATAVAAFLGTIALYFVLIVAFLIGWCTDTTETAADCATAQRRSEVVLVAGGVLTAVATISAVYGLLDRALGPARALVSRCLRLLFALVIFPLGPLATGAFGLHVQPSFGGQGVAAALLLAAVILTAWALALRRVAERRA
jgi:hypothetical protein